MPSESESESDNRPFSIGCSLCDFLQSGRILDGMAGFERSGGVTSMG